jgi:hypothetical protein
LKRLEAFPHEDFRNRGRWKDYEEAIEDMMEKRPRPAAPRGISFRPNDKAYGRLAARRIIADRLSKDVSLEPRTLDPKVIEAAEGLLGIRLAPPPPDGQCSGQALRHAVAPLSVQATNSLDSKFLLIIRIYGRLLP